MGGERASQALVGRWLAFKIVLSGADVSVSHELLDIVDLVTGLFEPKGEGGAQGMGRGAFGDAGSMDGGGDSRWMPLGCR